MLQIETIEIEQNSKMDINKILDGNMYLILQKGIPVAEVNPIKKDSNGWKRKIKKVKLKKNISTTTLIRQERDSK